MLSRGPASGRSTTCCTASRATSTPSASAASSTAGATKACRGSSSDLVHHQRLVHQPFEAAQEVVDFLFGRLGLDQFLHTTAEVVREVAADVDLATAQLVHDLEPADQAFGVLELDDAEARAVVDHVHGGTSPVLPSLCRAASVSSRPCRHAKPADERPHRVSFTLRKASRLTARTHCSIRRSRISVAASSTVVI